MSDTRFTDETLTPAGAVAWAFLSDQVMGGQSQGGVDFDGEAIRLRGRVSTENRGGFLQVRTRLAAPLPETATGLIVRVRGTPERYFLHIRTDGTTRPWQFYQAAFDATTAWRDLRVPFSAFAAKGGAPEGPPAPETVRSIALAAYGRDHEADVSLAAIGLY